MAWLPLAAAVAPTLLDKIFGGGSSEKHKRVETLLPNQVPIQNQLSQAAQGRGAGGAFGTSADYYRNLLSDDNADLNAFAAPEMRRFNEEIIPGLSEQFAGMGAGGLDSSGFRNAAVNAGSDLAERLGAIRAQLRQSGAQGLQNIGAQSLGNFSQDVMTQPGSQGFGATLAPAAGQVAGSGLFDFLKNTPKVGKNSSPYGNNPATSSSNMNGLPSFNPTLGLR